MYRREPRLGRAAQVRLRPNRPSGRLDLGIAVSRSTRDFSGIADLVGVVGPFVM